MNKLYAITLCIFIIGCSQKKESLKVMTWNIWHGGLNGKKIDNYKKDTANTINVLKVLENDLLFRYCSS